MVTIYEKKETAERQYTKCDRCGGRIACPSSTCMWAGVLAEGGEGKTYCTAPDVPQDYRVTRYGQ